MDTSKLPPETRHIWERLEAEPLLKGFVLIDGSALALRIGHRISEDLDFACLDELLPKLRLQQLSRMLNSQGIRFELNQSTAAEQEFIDSGLLLEDHQQNYLANNIVKISFVRLENNVTELLSGGHDSPLRVATLDEIFETKALVCADRSKSRDWFDLYILLTRHGYDINDMYRVFEEADCVSKFKIADIRLRACNPGRADEGYLQLVDPAPSLDELRAFFIDALDKWEIALSKAAFKTKRDTGSAA
jgi:predicted nucleotidyltransferase component of viral defense system